MKLGTIVKGAEIGKEGWKRYENFIWQACVACGVEQWIPYRQSRNKTFTGYCTSCLARRKRDRHAYGRGNRHPHWKGGQTKDKGYVHILLSPDDPYFPMASKSKRRVFEHRLVMAKHLGRCLKPYPLEVVHHIDGNRRNNKIDNLELIGSHTHNQITFLTNRVEALESRVTQLEAENVLLRVGGELIECSQGGSKPYRTRQ